MKPGTLPEKIGVVVAGLSVSAALAYLARWQLAIYFVIPLLSCLLGIVLAILASMTLRQAKTRETDGLHRVGNNLLLASLFLLSQLASLPIAQVLRDREVKRAQEFVEALIPQLEDYRSQHNTYPADISSVLDAKSALPPLLQLTGAFPFVYDNRLFYFYRETTYGFQFYLPDGFIGFNYEYCCGASGKWTVTD